MYFYLNLKQGQGVRPCAAHNNPKLMGVPPPGHLKVNGLGGEGTPENSF